MTLSFLLLSCGRPEEDAVSAATASWPVAEKTAVAVETSPVLLEPFIQGIEASGIVEGIREADVVSETAGIIQEVFFEIGDPVEKGDLLLTVENDTARSSLNFALQDLKTAELEFEAVEKSYNTGGTSLVSFNQSLTRLEAARLQYVQAKDAFENTEITAPFSGYISLRNSDISIGSFLNTGVPVTHIVDSTSFQIRLSVGEQDIAQIRQDARARVFINALPDRSMDAVVQAVSPGSSRSGGSFPVVVQWENITNGAIKSGMSARVVLLPDSNSRKDLIVPAGSIVYRNGMPYVFTVSEGSAQPVEVDIDRILGNRVALKSGLSEGEQVIVSGLSGLVPGDPVLPSPAGQ